MGVNHFTPHIAIKKEGKDITKSLKVLSLSFVDYERENIDTLSLTLAPSATLPNLGDRLELFLGRKDLYFFGAFYVSTITESFLQNFSIKLLSIDYQKGFKLKKSRAFEMSYGDALRKIARENNLKTKLDFAHIDEVSVTEQLDLSDASLCNSLAQKLNCAFAIKNNTLIFIGKGKEKRKTYKLKATECQSLELEHTNTTSYKSIIATYWDITEEETKSIKYRSGDPTLSRNYTAKMDATQAMQRAKNDLEKTKSGRSKGNLVVCGKAIFAGGILLLEPRGEERKFLIT